MSSHQPVDWLWKKICSTFSWQQPLKKYINNLFKNAQISNIMQIRKPEFLWQTSQHARNCNYNINSFIEINEGPLNTCTQLKQQKSTYSLW